MIARALKDLGQATGVAILFKRLPAHRPEGEYEWQFGVYGPHVSKVENAKLLAVHGQRRVADEQSSIGSVQHGFKFRLHRNKLRLRGSCDPSLPKENFE